MGLLDKANEFLNSDKGEEVSDQAIQAAADAANKATDSKYAEQVDQGAKFLDDKIGKKDA